MQLRDPVHDPQPQSSATPCAADAKWPLAQALAYLGWNTRPAVTDSALHPLHLSFQGNLYDAFDWRMP